MRRAVVPRDAAPSLIGRDARANMLPTFANESDIPEAFRPGYELSGTEWRPKLIAELELERGKRTTLLDEKKEEERKRREAEGKFAELTRTVEAKEKGISEEELTRIRDAEAATRKPIEDERDRLQKENRKLKLTDRLRALALSAGVMVDRIDDAMVLIDARAELGDADGIVFKDATLKVSAMDSTAFFAALKIEKPWLFEFSGTGGSGSGGSTTTRTTTTTPTAQIDVKQRAAVMGSF